MFRRQRKPASPPGAGAGGGAATYQGLRAQILDMDPAGVGLAAGPGHPLVWGALMDMGFPAGVATLVALADGTTSLYTSTGGGVIGGGSHQSVATATRAFLATVEAHLSELAPEAGTGLPGPGRVVIRALTHQGRRCAEAPEDDLGHGRHVLSPVFGAGHEVITRLRLLDEARGGQAGGSRLPGQQ